MGGGRKRGRTQRKHFKENRENVWKYKDSRNTRPEGAETDQNPKSNPHWEPFISQNPGFEDYYKEQCVVPKEEWDEFMNLLRKPLPAAFRINSSGQFSQEIRQQLENDFMKSLEAEVNNERENEAIRPLPWYPDNLAWHLNFSRMELRKNQTLERFHEFLKHENEVGNITRQEAVSMVPPLFLDVLPHHHILDMCAAPGSKTFQLLEIIHQSKELGVLPDGLVIANDVDVQRCNLLIHQTKRMCSANLIVTNHEAQHFPSCSLIKSRVKISKEGQEGLGKNTLQFDRVLCDVPCSGDGTLRKAPDIWRKWNAGMGNGIHCLQVAIAMRGIALLNVGGRMVYSTCSMNPVENEAVVAEILRRSNGSVELLDVSGELPALVRRHGLKTWKVRDRGLWLASYKDVPKYRRSAILRSMFPCYDEQEDILPLDSDGGAQMDHQPTIDIECKGNDESLIANQMEEVSGEGISLKGNDENSIDEVSKFPLERCMRIVPHDQNTGAFFIAVLQKVSPLQEDARNQSSNSTRKDSAMSESLKGRHDKHPIDESSVSKNVGLENKGEKEMDACVNGEKDDEGKVGKRRRSQTQSKWKGVDPVVFFEDEATISSICSYYGISESFPLKGHLVTRNTDADHVKRIYYVSKSVHDTLQLNFQVWQRLKITSLGLKVFERQASKDSSSSKFRLSSEGLPLLLPYISKQILCASLADFRRLLRHRLIKFVDFVDTEFREKASGLMPGCCVVVLTEGKQDITDSFQVDPSTLAIVCWKGKTNMSILVSELDGKELLERLSVRYGSDQSAVDAEPMSRDLVTDTLEDQEDGVLDEPNPEDDEVDGAEIANLETA